MAVHLVLGGRGNVGAALSRSLVRHGHRVRSIDRRRPASPLSGVEEWTADIRSAAVLEQALKNVDVIYFSIVHIRFLAPEPEMYAANVEPLDRLLGLALARRVRKVVVVSTSLIHGAQPRLPTGRGTEARPLGLYGRMRLAAERVVQSFLERGLEAVVLRPHIVLGAGCPGLLAPVFRRVAGHRKVWLPRAMASIHQLVDVEDFAEACRLAASATASGFFDVGAAAHQSLVSLLERLIADEGSRSRIDWLPPLPAQSLAHLESRLGRCLLGPGELSLLDDGLHADAGAARTELGWNPSHGEYDIVRRSFRAFSGRPAG